MDVFTFTPGGSETLEAFNLRLKKYATDYDVVGVVSGVLGSTLVLSLTLGSDGVFSPVAVQPLVMLITPEYEKSLETALTQVINDVKKLDNPDGEVMSVPLEARCVPCPGEGRLGYILLLTAIGELDPEEG